MLGEPHHEGLGMRWILASQVKCVVETVEVMGTTDNLARVERVHPVRDLYDAATSIIVVLLIVVLLVIVLLTVVLLFVKNLCFGWLNDETILE